MKRVKSESSTKCHADRVWTGKKSIKQVLHCSVKKTKRKEKRAVLSRRLKVHSSPDWSSHGRQEQIAQARLEKDLTESYRKGIGTLDQFTEHMFGKACES